MIVYCAGKPGAEETYPWGETELVCKVGGKAFAFIGLDVHTVGLKCGTDAEAAAVWRERFPADVTVSGYIGRYGWNTVALKGAVPDDDLLELVDGSYDAVVARLPKGKRPAV
ncbi:MmcQ/YjbR family DNA-binding protein [Streptomyces sp. ID05-26A]|nr:MmcQ/YjbR family DNA-binding protein [Streptomyces sp. ID05-26A]